MKYLAISAMTMAIFIGLCCLMMVISIICGFVTGKCYYNKSKQATPRSKNGYNGDSYNQIDVVSDDQV